jgi:CDP-glycerol glycerophosphotransferase (TagB/SpsB family)
MKNHRSEKKYTDNPNPSANVGFIICYPFQFYVYKNIYKHIANSEFIVDLGVFFPSKQPSELADEIISLLKAKNAKYRILYYSDYYYYSYRESFFSKYDTLVSLWERGCINFACNIEKKKVNLTYGAGKELTQVRPSRRIYDLILTFGQRDHKLFSIYTKAEIVGNPKFDDWFNDDLDGKFIEEMRKKLDDKKKTALYLPTHGDLGSIKQLEEKLGKIAGKYNVIAKIHYFTIREEPELMKELAEKGVIIYEDSADLLPMLKVADVVISDNSSAIFDAILADKPIAVTNFLSDEFLDLEHKKPKMYRRGERGALTYSGSVEQEIKKKELVITIDKPSDLECALEKAAEDESFFKNARREIREELFSFNDGKCGKRAAEEIEKVKKNKKKPIMFHAIEALLNDLQKTRRSVVIRDMNYRRMKNYEDMIAEKVDREGLVFSVILIGPGKFFPEESLRALIGQKFNRESYEILVLSRDYKGVKENIDRMLAKENNFPSINIVRVENNQIGPGIKKAIEDSRGKIICFTKVDCVTVSDWLNDIYSAYQRNPSVAGVGGFSVCREENYSLIDEFDNLEIARKLGIWKERNYLSKLYEVRNRRFEQNPAGSLANMSYQKEILAKYKDLFSARPLSLIELGLKYEILLDRSEEICFIPNPVIKISKQTWKSFLRRNFFRGFVFSGFARDKKKSGFYGKNSFFSPFKESILNLLDGNSRRRLAMSLLIFVGYFYQWLGSLYFRASGFVFWLKGRKKRLEQSK